MSLESTATSNITEYQFILFDGVLNNIPAVCSHQSEASRVGLDLNAMPSEGGGGGGGFDLNALNAMPSEGGGGGGAGGFDLNAMPSEGGADVDLELKL
ncbi:hypothetical protein Acr_16g0002880 [Actinidia rufa]|uniref:Uncharacterized protein n=1 Tax=Actinidia rufa TaxID=165716 RepID=A0A7J0FYN1_9ERIC|nr:hypothetical protein Acr_16g0002880 [Actinidia rufa]